MFRTRLRLQQHLNRCSNKNQCLRKWYLRRRQEVQEEGELVQEEEEEEVVEEEVAALLEKIVSKYR